MVKKLIKSSVKNGSSILFSKQKSILSGAFVIGTMLFASAILGLIKQRLYASVITPGPELDAFFAAFRIPDLLFTLLIGGSLNAAFIPLFSHYIEKKSRKATWEFASSVLNVSLIFFVLLSIIFYIFADYVAYFVGSGFETENFELLVRLMRIILISPILLGLSSFISGVLQSFQRFIIPFFSPVVYNLGAILGVVVLYPIFGIEGAAWGVVVGSFAHLLIQLPALRHIGFNYKFVMRLKDATLKQLVTLSIPRTIGVGIEQFKVLLLINLASFFPAGSISFFNLGQSITNIPASILGLSIAQASLPQFAQLFAQKDMSNLKRTFESSFNQILFFIAPVTVFLIALKIPIVRLVYGAGNFSWSDTILTSWVVAFFAIGLFAHALNNLIIRLYYARQITKLPVLLGLIGTAASLLIAFLVKLNIITDIHIGNILLIPISTVSGLAFAVSAGAILEFVLLIIALAKDKIIELKTFITTPSKILFSAAVMTLVVYFPVQMLDAVFIDTTRVVNLIILVWLVVSTGLTTYLLVTWFLGVRELQVVFRVLWKIKDFQKNITKLVQSTPQIPPVTIRDGIENET